MNAIIIAVGNELISGQTVDTNSAHLARELERQGIETTAHWTVGDDRRAIAEAIADAAGRAAFVVITGGLGPTLDDLTRHGLADAMGVGLALDEPSLARLKAFFRLRGRQMVPTNRIQAMMPVGAEAIENPNGTAPGIAAKLGRAWVYVMPGVPHEMRAMFAERIAPRLPSDAGAIVQRIVHTFGTGESDIGERIADLMARGTNPTVGTTVQAGLISIRVVSKGRGLPEADALARRTTDEIRRRLGDLVVGEGDSSLASVVGEALRRAGQTLATAESCTGGLLGELITSVPGSSDYYLGGVVSYANRAKRELLGVAQNVLEAHGAVSEPVAAAMAEGCRRRLASDWAIGITGIAGPGGGSEAKPVGLVYIALAGPDGTRVCRHVFPGDREAIRHRAGRAALDLLRLALPRE